MPSSLCGFSSNGGQINQTHIFLFSFSTALNIYLTQLFVKFYFAFIYVFMCAQGYLRKVLVSLELKLQVELPDVGPVNWSRVLWKSNKGS